MSCSLPQGSSRKEHMVVAYHMVNHVHSDTEETDRINATWLLHRRISFRVANHQYSSNVELLVQDFKRTYITAPTNFLRDELRVLQTKNMKMDGVLTSPPLGPYLNTGFAIQTKEIHIKMTDQIPNNTFNINNGQAGIFSPHSTVSGNTLYIQNQEEQNINEQAQHYAKELDKLLNDLSGNQELLSALGSTKLRQLVSRLSDVQEALQGGTQDEQLKNTSKVKDFLLTNLGEVTEKVISGIRTASSTLR